MPFTPSHKASMGFIFITIFVDVIGLGIIIPVLPSLIETLIHGGLSEASKYGGWLMFSFAFMQFIFAPLLGELSDKYGRRPILLMALFGLGVDYIFHAFAPSIGWLFVGRVLAGITGASYTVATAYIADISTPEKKAQNFGLIGAAFGMGFIIGPVIGGVCSKWGVQVPFLVAAALTLLNLVYGFFVLPESLSKENRRDFDWKKANPVGSIKHLKIYPVVFGLIISVFLINLAGHSVQSTWTFYTMFKFGWDETIVGYSLGTAGLLVAIAQAGLIKFAMKTLGEQRTVIVGLALSSIGLFLFAIASHSWMMFAFLIPYCIGGIGNPALQGIMSNQIPDNEQGELQGAITSIIGLTSILGPPLMTNLFYNFTTDSIGITFPGAPFLAGSFFCVAGLIFAAKTLSKLKIN